ncbi:MAG: Dabb family protein [Chthoniobacterales bacterium]
MTRLSLVLALLVTACTAPRSGGIEHAVFVWLKRPGNEVDRAALVEGTKQLQKSTGLITSFRHGTPVSSARPVVDDSFDLALLMRFQSRAALAAFETHPDHLRAKKELLQPLARKVLIYDVALD